MKAEVARIYSNNANSLDRRMGKIYELIRKAGFTPEHAFWLMTEHKTFPDWIVGDGGIIPSIDPTDDEDDD